jgi:hypothetical protein
VYEEAEAQVAQKQLAQDKDTQAEDEKEHQEEEAEEEANVRSKRKWQRTDSRRRSPRQR